MAPAAMASPFLLAATVAGVAPAIPAGAAGAQPSRLRITNGCNNEPLWIAHMAAAGIGPDPQNVQLAPLQSYNFATFDGLSGTRYWPKMRCDAQGNRCEVGESGGPEEVCHATAGCAPPVDTKFEASFGQNREDWVDISLVDGFTLPFKFEMRGNCTAGFGDKAVTSNVIDCSRLSFDQCPTTEDLGALSPSMNLKLLHPDTKEAVGCYSPCSKLTLNQWGNTDASPGMPPSDPKVAPYCCPTPPESPHACRRGPVPNTSFVEAIHAMCPGVYGYSYDDGMGLLKCSSDTRYEVTFFCPAPGLRPVTAALPAGPGLPPGLPPPPAAGPVQPTPDQTPAFLAFVRKFDGRQGVGSRGSEVTAAVLMAALAAALLAAIVLSALVAAAWRRSHRPDTDSLGQPVLYEQLERREGLEPGATVAAATAVAAA